MKTLSSHPALIHAPDIVCCLTCNPFLSRCKRLFSSASRAFSRSSALSCSVTCSCTSASTDSGRPFRSRGGDRGTRAGGALLSKAGWG